MPALLCLGWEEDLALRASDRRAVKGPSAEEVVNAWKAVFENAQVDVDKDDVQSPFFLVEKSQERCVESVFLAMRGFPSSTTRYMKTLVKRLKAS